MGGRRSILAGLISVVLITGLVGTLPTAAAGKKKKAKRVERVEERTYVGAIGPRGAADVPCQSEPISCVKFPVEAGEKFVSIEVVDMSGQPVWASIYIYGYTDGSDTHEHVCGASDGPIALGAGLEELVVVVTQTTGGATSPCTGAATTGTIVGTFSNIP
jgi:hypothetical protein